MGVWNANVVKENFVEIGAARHLTQGLHLHARRMHVDHEARQSLVLWQIEI